MRGCSASLRRVPAASMRALSPGQPRISWRGRANTRWAMASTAANRLRGGLEAGLDDVDPQPPQLVGDLEPSPAWFSHRDSGRLLAVAQGRVEDPYSVLLVSYRRIAMSCFCFLRVSSPFLLGLRLRGRHALFPPPPPPRGERREVEGEREQTRSARLQTNYNGRTTCRLLSLGHELWCVAAALERKVERPPAGHTRRITRGVPACPSGDAPWAVPTFSMFEADYAAQLCKSSSHHLKRGMLARCVAARLRQRFAALALHHGRGAMQIIRPPAFISE